MSNFHQPTTLVCKKVRRLEADSLKSLVGEIKTVIHNVMRNLLLRLIVAPFHWLGQGVWSVIQPFFSGLCNLVWRVIRAPFLWLYNLVTWPFQAVYNYLGFGYDEASDEDYVYEPMDDCEFYIRESMDDYDDDSDWDDESSGYDPIDEEELEDLQPLRRSRRLLGLGPEDYRWS